MDTITHALLGATIAEAGFRRRLGGRSVAWAAFAAAAPDLDLIALAGGEWNELTHHRAITHSLIALSAAAPVLGAFAWRWPGKRQGHVLEWIHLTFWALVSHALLDACTAYGTQLLAPASSQRFAIDAISIVDLAYSLPLLIATVFAVARNRIRGARVAIGALVVTTLYLGFGFVQSRRAIAWANEDLASMGFEPIETRAMPTIGNVLVYRVVARDGRGRYRIAHVSLSAPRPPRWYAVRDDEDPLVDAARASERGWLFDWFAMGMDSAELRRGDYDFTVQLSDLRYGSLRDPRVSMFRADARFSMEGDLLGVDRAGAELDLGAELATLWAFVIGDDAKLAEELTRAEPTRSPTLALSR